MFLIILYVIGGLLSFHLLSKVSVSQRIKSDIANLVLALNDARRSEKDFLLFDRKEINFLEHGTSPVTIKHARLIYSLDSAIAALKKEGFVTSLGLQKELNEIETSVRSYHLSFKSVVESMYVRGFKDHGLEGQMRSYVHDLQKCISPQEKVFAFSLRRHEKDFLMRKDIQYVKKLHKTAEAFKTFILEADMEHMDSTYKTTTISAIDAYVAHFNKIVKIEKEIGLTEGSGIIGKMNAETTRVEPLVARIYHIINKQAADSYKNSMFVLAGSMIMLFLIGLVLSLSLSTAIAKPIVLLDEATKAVLNGTPNVTLQLKSINLKDEIGSLISNFINMVDKIEENLKVITEKNSQLEAAALEDIKRNWKNTGINQLNEILKVNKHIEELGPEIITMLVNYTKSNQGMLFIINEENKEDPFMEMKGCYAYEKRKYLTGRIFRKGEGLLGAAWIEKNRIFLTDVPGNYINITSGLGEATPKSILIVPVIADDKVVALIEIASFNIFESHEISFLEAAAERLAHNLSSIKANQNTQSLLMEFSQEIEALKVYEEELKQNLEALKAEREETKRDSISTHQKTASL